MTPTFSLRGKILLLLSATVFVIAVFVAALSQRDITRTVSDRERRAVGNTMNLVSVNLATRWSTLLNDKIRAVRNERAQLMETGALVRSTLESHARETQAGLLPREQAQASARAWVDRLAFENQRQVLIYDRKNLVLASTDAALIGKDISALLDFKGRPLAEAMREESRTFGHGFAIYAAADARADELRFAHFDYFEAWDWVLVVSDSAQTITRQAASRKTALESEIHETLSSLVLAQSGFMFIIADDGNFIVPPPKAFLEEAGGEEGARDALRAALNAASEMEGSAEGSRVFRLSLGKETWQAEAAHFRPLAWTLAAMVPETDLTLPARQLVDRQAEISAVILCLALLCAFLFATCIVRPLAQLTQFARALPGQDFLSQESKAPEHIAALPAKSRDEIGLLAAAFLFMDRRLRENIRLLVRETASRERIESELDIARAIQLGLLPVPLPAALSATLSLKAHMLPAREVGGDLCDYFTLSETELCFVIGDVSGKGVPAALFMAITRTLIRSAARDETDPGAMTRVINDRLSETNPNLMFVTLFLGILNLESGELRYVNAGHPPPILITRDKTPRQLAGRSGPACGVRENLAYRAFLARLEPGDTLLGYTDGVTEAVNEAGARYGEARLLENLNHPARNAEETTARLLTDIETFTAGSDPFDDITLIAVQLLTFLLVETVPQPTNKGKSMGYNI